MAASNIKDPNVPLTEMIKFIPGIFGIRVNEEPDYHSMLQDGPFEIRRYGKQLHAKVTLYDMDLDMFRETAFKILSSYIFGENVDHKYVAMTSPVLQSASQGMTMSFILPAKYDLASIPKPENPTIRLEEVTGGEVACITYTGNNSAQNIQLHRDELARWILHTPGVRAKGGFVIAQYDPPFSLPFMKRNEIMAPITLARCH